MGTQRDPDRRGSGHRRRCVRSAAQRRAGSAAEHQPDVHVGAAGAAHPGAGAVGCGASAGAPGGRADGDGHDFAGRKMRRRSFRRRRWPTRSADKFALTALASPATGSLVSAPWRLPSPDATRQGTACCIHFPPPARSEPKVGDRQRCVFGERHEDGVWEVGGKQSVVFDDHHRRPQLVWLLRQGIAAPVRLDDLPGAQRHPG